MAQGHLKLEHEYEAILRVKQGDVVLDIGASPGDFVLSCAARAGLIIAVESVNMNTAIQNIGELDNVMLIEKAVSNYSGMGTMYLRDDPGSSSLILRSEYPEMATISVEVDTIDNIMAALRLKRLDFIKMDIEGTEIEALEGAEETLRYTRKLVIAAYHIYNPRHNGRTCEPVAEHLSQRGFDVLTTGDALVHAWRG